MLPGQAPKKPNLLVQVLLLTLPALAWAQAEGDVPVDEAIELEAVKITAERRETALQKTPVSVGVIGGQALEKTGFQHLFDIEKNVAGVSFFKGASNQQSSIIIRGVGTTNQGYTQAVGVYVDDVPLARSVAAGQWDLPDLERIEVLRGPQGTLYGQNSTAGAVRIISRNPTDEKVGWVSAGLGNYSSREARGYFAGPLKEGLLAGSVAFSYRKRDGYGTNLSTGDDIYGADVAQGRAKLRLTPGGGWDAVLAIDGLLDKSDNGTNATPLNYGNTAPRDTWAVQDLTQSKLKRGGANLQISKAISDDLRLRSITSYRAYKHDPDYMDIGGLPRYSNTWHQTVEQDVFFQEFQLQGDWGDRLSYTAGVLYQSENWQNNNWSYRGLADGVTINRQLAKTEYDTSDVALYGQFDYRLTDKWSLTAGARYWRTSQTYDGSAYNLDENLQEVSERFSVSGLKKTSSGVTPRLTLGYQWTPETYTYASYTKGAKFGGHNRSASTAQVASVAANPEKVTAYELGVKNSAFNNRLQVNAAIFYNDYKDYLASVSNPTINGVLYNGSVLTNAAKAETYGADIELRARLTRRLDWNVALSYVHTEFKDFGYGGESYVGNHLTYAPEYSVVTGLSYVQPLANGDELSIYGSVQHTAKQYSDEGNTERGTIPRRTNVDIGADYRFAGGHWTAGVKVRNLLDKDQILLKSYIPVYGIESSAYDAPRTIVATLRYDF
ncbi:TonB-dependent receptor [Corticibacter populi]|nr:TonB-dependent receptor [Corticibacter populi]